MHQKGIVKDLEVIVEDTQRIALCHFITLPLPGEPLIVQRISVRADENGLPVHKVAQPLPYVEDVQARALGGQHPLLGLGHVVAAGAHLLVEGDGGAVLEHGHQLPLVAR